MNKNIGRNMKVIKENKIESVIWQRSTVYRCFNIRKLI